MPTFGRLPELIRENKRLSDDEKALFKHEVRQWVLDLKQFGLQPTDPRVKGVRGAPGIFEFRWAADGRATFQFGAERRPSEPHIIWRRVGTHAILKRP
jgi:hypothetical protein